jgi:hypothetical protein
MCSQTFRVATTGLCRTALVDARHCAQQDQVAHPGLRLDSQDFRGGVRPQLNAVETPVKIASANSINRPLKARQAIGAAVNFQREDMQ